MNFLTHTTAQTQQMIGMQFAMDQPHDHILLSLCIVRSAMEHALRLSDELSRIPRISRCKTMRFWLDSIDSLACFLGAIAATQSAGCIYIDIYMTLSHFALVRITVYSHVMFANASKLPSLRRPSAMMCALRLKIQPTRTNMFTHRAKPCYKMWFRHL